MRSASRRAGFWASWADCLPMIHARHPEVAARIIAQLEGDPSGQSVQLAADSAHRLTGVRGFEPPSWRALAAGLRPPHDQEQEKSGWQHEASSRIEQEHRESLFRVLPEPERALLRSQGGSGAGAAVQTCPTCPLTRIDPALFRVLLLRRLRLPLPLSIRNCRCGRPLDSRGHHRAACARAGVLGRRGFPVESAVARICREGGARVTTNVMVRDMTWRFQILEMRDGWRSGCHCSRHDLNFLFALRGTARPGTDTDGAALTAARRRKERTYPELVGPRGRARLVVLAGEVGGRWSAETMSFLSQLAKAKTRHEPHILRQRVQQAWRSRWQAILSCAAAKVFARSLLEMRAAVGADGDTPASHDVLRDFHGPCRVGLSAFIFPVMEFSVESILFLSPKKNKEIVRNQHNVLQCEINGIAFWMTLKSSEMKNFLSRRVSTILKSFLVASASCHLALPHVVRPILRVIKFAHFNLQNWIVPSSSRGNCPCREKSV